MSVKDALDTFGKSIVSKAKANLKKSGKSDTGALENSIKYDVKVHKRSFSFSLMMEDYGIFIDKGVKGVSSSQRAPNSPFKFGTGTGKKGGLTEGTLGWVTRKRIQFKDRKTGRFYSYKQTAFVIARSIWHKGIRTTNFITAPFESEFKKLPGELVQAYALDVNKFIKNAFKQ